MRTCASCGAVKVYVDGKLRRVVALTGTTSVRRTVYSVSFGKPGRHTIKVVTVVKGKQKKVAIDAVVVRH